MIHGSGSGDPGSPGSPGESSFGRIESIAVGRATLAAKATNTAGASPFRGSARGAIRSWPDQGVQQTVMGSSTVTPPLAWLGTEAQEPAPLGVPL